MSSTHPARESADLEPAWDVALLFPPQGEWTEEDYLALNTNRLVEFSDGFIEVLPMPTVSHQLIAAFLFKLLDTFVESNQLGRVLFAPLKIRLRRGKFREPDIVFLKRGDVARMGNSYWKRADLVIEVVIEDDRDRDLKKKRREYAATGIPEYWIVDPVESKVIVLALDRRKKKRVYGVHGEFGLGARATSKLLPGFAVNVTSVFSQQP
jgi:Uma2 family endonuclease